MTENWEFTHRDGKWFAIEQNTRAMLIAPTREEIEEIIQTQRKTEFDFT